MRHCLTLSDEQLLLECRFEAFRGSGPGGQKRNKTSSAVRVTHIPTDIAITASESRSQAQNRTAALRRLRHRIALSIRLPPHDAKSPAANLDISPRSAQYPQAMALILDVLSDAGWSVSEAARRLGVSTARLVGFLRADDKLWTEANRQRQKIGLRPLVQ